jgi:hypothetical protein
LVATARRQTQFVKARFGTDATIGAASEQGGYLRAKVLQSFELAG